MDWSCQVVILMAKTWELGSWIAFFLAFLLSSVNARVASEIQGFFFGLWIPRTSSAAFLMIVVVCSNRESAMGSLVSTSSSSNWNLFCSSNWKSFAMLGSSTIIEKISWDARSILVFVFLRVSANFRPCFSNNNVHVAWTLLQPISLPYPHQAMLRGPTRKLTTWLLSTLCRGKRGPNSITAIKSSQHFFQWLSVPFGE